jgi:hypothetical protein
MVKIPTRMPMVNNGYPLVICDIAIENGYLVRGSSLKKCGFSIATSVF